jgi:rhodanese-related sulfurtransferase
MSNGQSAGFQSMSPKEVKQLMDRDEVQILDVRELWEYEYCRLDGSVHIPLSILPLRHSELQRNAVTVVICHHGNRSYFACRWLEKEGFTSVINLSGGIAGWSQSVDPSVPTY